MAVFKINKNKDYTVMSNYHLRDKELSLKAKGLLSMMLGLPEDWNFSVKGLSSISKESEGCINSTLQELERNGYLIRTRIFCNGKISNWQYDIYELPQPKNDKQEEIDNEQEDKNLDVKNPHVENSGVYKVLNNKIFNNKKINTINSIYTKKQQQYMHLLDSILTEYNFSDTVYNLIDKFFYDRISQNIFSGEYYIRSQLNDLMKLGVYEQEESIKNSLAKGYKSMTYLDNNSKSKGFEDTAKGPQRKEVKSGKGEKF